jgi:hypothetical protein
MDPQYPQAYGGGPPPPPQGNGLAVASLVCGLVGLIFFGVILGPLAIIFGAIGIGKANQIGGKGKGLAIAGLVIGVVDLLVFFVVFALVFKR